jgi:dTDP-4-amino-4,6-dideoxygalactose transaminase
MNRIHLSAPDISAADQTAVARAMASAWVAPVGPELDAFEAEMAERIGVAHAVALSSGTAALHLGLLAAGVGPGTAVVTSTFTFAATANAITYTGARPVFVDVDPVSGNLDPVLLDRALAELHADGVVVSAVMPVDIYGKSVDYPGILEVSGHHGVPVVADSAEGVGATADGRPVGSFGSSAAFSFNGNKIMTTSGGGMLLTDDMVIATTARRLASQARLPVPHYEHAEVGFNYRMSNVLAALGRSQLARLDDMIAQRRSIRGRYRALVATIPGVEILGGGDDAEDNCWLTSIVVDQAAGHDVRALSAALDADGIESRLLWNPMHRQPAFAAERAFVSGAADALFATGLSLPSGSGMTADQLDRVCTSLATALRSDRVAA